MMRKLSCTLLCVLLFSHAAAWAAEPRYLSSRQGDNTIYMTWDAEQAKVTQATSSRRITSEQKIELLTRLVDRTDVIVMRAVLKNISERRRYRIDGQLRHKVFLADAVVEELETKVFHTVLAPGEKITARFRYTLGTTGEYSVRTNYKRV